MSSDPVFVSVVASELIPYEHAVWCSIGDGEPFANEIVVIKPSEDGLHLWLCLDSHNTMKVRRDEIVKVVERG